MIYMYIQSYSRLPPVFPPFTATLCTIPVVSRFHHTYKNVLLLQTPATKPVRRALKVHIVPASLGLVKRDRRMPKKDLRIQQKRPTC